jgi:hypothetical protein
MAKDSRVKLSWLRGYYILLISLMSGFKKKIIILFNSVDTNWKIHNHGVKYYTYKKK